AGASPSRGRTPLDGACSRRPTTPVRLESLTYRRLDQREGRPRVGLTGRAQGARAGLRGDQNHGHLQGAEQVQIDDVVPGGRKACLSSTVGRLDRQTIGRRRAYFFSGSRSATFQTFTRGLSK